MRQDFLPHFPFGPSRLVPLMAATRESGCAAVCGFGIWERGEETLLTFPPSHNHTELSSCTSPCRLATSVGTGLSDSAGQRPEALQATREMSPL